MSIDDLPPEVIVARLQDELTQRQFRVWTMRIVEEVSYQRIGDRLGISKQTAMFHFTAAQRKVQMIEWDLET